MKSPICEMLGIEFPLLAFSHCRDVVAAVSRAGGFGVLGATTHSPESIEQELKWIDDHVDGKPYGLDVLIPENISTSGETDVTWNSLAERMFLGADQCCDGNAVPVAHLDHRLWRHAERVGDQADRVPERGVEHFQRALRVERLRLVVGDLGGR